MEEHSKDGVTLGGQVLECNLLAETILLFPQSKLSLLLNPADTSDAKVIRKIARRYWCMALSGKSTE